MDFPTSISTCFSKYATFEGRASRSEYWWFSVFSVLAVVITFFGSASALGIDTALIFYYVLSLLFFLPSISVTVRRLHDTNHSGWNYWWAIVPFGGLYLFYLMCEPSDVGANNYGTLDENNGYQNIQPRGQNPLPPINPQPYQPKNNTPQPCIIELSIGSLYIGGREYRLQLGENIIGRNAPNSNSSVRLDVLDQYMSREQCRITVVKNGSGYDHCVESIKPQNLVYIGGKPLPVGKVEVILFGEKLQMGKTEVIFHRAGYYGANTEYINR